MIQIQDLTIIHRKDLRTIIDHMQFVLNTGDKAVIIGEEGNGKSTLLKWMAAPSMLEDYAEANGSMICHGEIIGYLPQELSAEDREKSVYEFFSSKDYFWDISPKDLSRYAKDYNIEAEVFYDQRKMKTLSGGERVKLSLIRVLMEGPTVLFLDEPSNDIDIKTLELLEKVIKEFHGIVLFISHDKELITRTANMIIHMEQIKRKTEFRYTVSHTDYESYMKKREDNFSRQLSLAENEKAEKKKRDEKYRRMMQSVEHAQSTVSRQNPAAGRLLKKKMHAVKSMEKRFVREDEGMTQRPEQESEIYFVLGNRESRIPNGKVVIDLFIDKLEDAGSERILARNLKLRINGSEKICIIGDNGCGKTTFLKRIVEVLEKRSDINMQYMPQNYEDLLKSEETPAEYLNISGDKGNETKIRTYLGALKYTRDEMDHPIRELSGGQKAKIFLLKMSLSNANVLVLDEPTRNFSPMSGRVVRQMIKDFPGAVISISHDRKYIDEVCDRVLVMTKQGLEDAKA